MGEQKLALICGRHPFRGEEANLGILKRVKKRIWGNGQTSAARWPVEKTGGEDSAAKGPALPSTCVTANGRHCWPSSPSLAAFVAGKPVATPPVTISCCFHEFVMRLPQP